MLVIGLTGIESILIYYKNFTVKLSMLGLGNNHYKKYSNLLWKDHPIHFYTDFIDNHYRKSYHNYNFITTSLIMLSGLESA